MTFSRHRLTGKVVTNGVEAEPFAEVEIYAQPFNNVFRISCKSQPWYWAFYSLILGFWHLCISQRWSGSCSASHSSQFYWSLHVWRTGDLSSVSPCLRPRDSWDGLQQSPATLVAAESRLQWVMWPVAGLTPWRSEPLWGWTGYW